MLFSGLRAFFSSASVFQAAKRAATKPRSKPKAKPKTRSSPKRRKTRAEAEIGGPSGPEPTRYGDWERRGRLSDF